MTIQSRFRPVGIQGALSPVKLRYLAVAYAPLQITTPSRNVYEVYGMADFQVAEQDLAWFLSRRDERGRLLYQVITPEPAPEPTPAPVVEIEPAPPLSFSIQEELPVALDVEEEVITRAKKHRKNKEVE